MAVNSAVKPFFLQKLRLAFCYVPDYTQRQILANVRKYKTER